ncbi:cysteine synthase A [Thermococci archaeon]|nr:MAG: cysteine synthase A [Thermococci archaeon]
MQVKSDILSLIGNTPMVKLRKVTREISSSIFVKLEYMNPSGSIKDRIALYMIEDAEKRGILHPNSTIVEASTGNTGIALSFVAAMKGYKMKVFIPKLVSENEKLKIMRLYGAEIETVDTEETPKSRDKSVHGGDIEIVPRKKCLELENRDSSVWWARQFSNPYNKLAHKKTTGKEILEQTDGKIDAFVASVGTGGTLVGVGEALREEIPNIKIIAVEPAGFPLIRKGKSGIRIIEGITGGLLLEAVDIADEVLVIDDKEAINMANRLMGEEGLFCGISSGANVLASLKIAKKYPKLKNIVTVLPDRRDRYFTTERYTT